MQKIYLLFITTFYCFAVNAQSIILNCVKDLKLDADTMSCSRVVYGIDPILPNGGSLQRISYHLDGATKGDGNGSASGIKFNAGKTKVTYTYPTNPVLQCSFVVTIVSKAFVYPETNTLPDLKGTCSVHVVKVPVAINKCTGERIEGVTGDSLFYSKPGSYHVRWRYLVDGQVVLRQDQLVTVSRGSFTPRIDTLPEITGRCSVQVTSVPVGSSQCAGLLRATTNDALVYKVPGQYYIDWFYLVQKDTVYRQRQRVIVKGEGELVPDTKSLPTISGSCAVVVTKHPTATDSCSGTKVTARSLDPLRYDEPGQYKVRWIYVYGKDTLFQNQQVTVTRGRIIPETDSLPAINGSCSLTIIKKPIAIHSCTQAAIMAVPLDRLNYDQPGQYRLRWMYVYQQDTLIQVQQLNVRAGKIIPELDSLPVINANCSVAITKIPTAANCRGAVITAIPLSSLRYDQAGQYTIRWLYRDNHDSVIQTQRVNVQAGRLIPDSSSLLVINGSCSVVVTKRPTAKYSCNDSVVIAVALDPLRYDNPGVYSLRWRFTYNRDTLIRIQQVNVRAGKITPEVDSLPVINANCSIAITKIPTATNCRGSVIRAIPLSSLRYDQAGQYTIRWLYRDSHDSLIQTQRVSVQAGRLIADSSSLAVINASCSVVITKRPTARYSCNDSVVTAVALDPLKYDHPGVYSLRWRFIYNSDTLIRIQQVNVRAGKIAPTIDTLPVIHGSCSIAITKFPTATNCSGTLITAVPLDPLKYDRPGQYFVRWKYADRYDSLIQVQHVNVRNSGKLIPDDDTLDSLVGNCSVTISKIPTATNNCTGKRIQAVTSDPTSYTKQGKYNIHWVFVDNHDTLRQIQSLEVRSGQFLIPDADTLPALVSKCSVTINTKPTARNNCNGKLILGHTGDPLFYNKPGHYKVNWVFEDDSTAPLTQQQIVIIESSQQLVPDIASLPELIGDCSVSVVARPTAKNTCTGETITAFTTDPLVYSHPGQYTIHWRFDDSNPNGLVQTQTIIVKNSKRIVPHSSDLPVVEEFCSVTITNPPTAANRCTGKIITGTTQDPVSYSVPGEYAIRWAYMDNNDTLYQTQKIVVKNSLSLLETSLPDITGDCEVRIYKIPVAVNSCKRIIKAATGDPLVYSVPGTYTITWTYKDGDKTITQTQRVTVLKRELSVKVYPNPTPHEFMIHAKTCQRHEKLDLRVYDIAGRLVEAKQVNVNQEVRFGSAYPASAYFAHVIWNEKRYVFKLIKSRR